jgi:hypothetical protein
MTRSEKMQETKARKAAEYDAQTVRIDENWKIIRVDELNWEIQFKGKFKGYYPTISSALKALPAKMLSETARNSLADVLRSQDAIVELIQRALP